MSKGSFKRAIGHLYKQKIINIETGKISLTKKVGLVWKNNKILNTKRISSISIVESYHHSAY